MPHLQQKFMGDDSIDVSTDSEFFGLTTFANLPYVNCLKPDESEGGRYDIAILGAPFDTVSRVMRMSSLRLLLTGSRVSRVDRVLDSDLQAFAEDHREWPQVMLGVSTQVRKFTLFPDFV